MYVASPTTSSEELGGKAANLRRLALEFPVPPFLTLVASAAGDNAPPDNLSELVQLLVGGDRFAVRSSASSEDSARASFAGLFESRLGVACDELAGAVAAVRRSASSSRVQSYCAAQGIDPSDIRVAVIIQRMIASEIAGVSLSKTHAGSGDVIIEAVYGLGEYLVAGTVDPDRYLVSRSGSAAPAIHTAYQEFALYLTTDGPCRRQIPVADRTAQKLLLREIREVADLSVGVEQALGYEAADVEWAYEDGSLFLLQGRPYVGLPRH